MPTKVHLWTIVKAMVFPVVTYECESWTIKKAEHRRIDAFELWCWRRLLRVPWAARVLNQSILKEISSEYSLEGLMLKLKLQYFGHLIWRTDSLEETLMLGKTEGRRRRGWQSTEWLDGITDSIDMSLSRLRELVMDREAWHATIRGVTKNWTRLSNWTELMINHEEQNFPVISVELWYGCPTTVTDRILNPVAHTSQTLCPLSASASLTPCACSCIETSDTHSAFTNTGLTTKLLVWDITSTPLKNN